MERSITKEPICDGHVHFFPETLYYAIHDWFSRAGWKLPYRWPPEKKKQYLKDTGVSRAFLLVYAHKPDMSMAVNQWVRDFAAADDFFFPFGCVHPSDADLKNVLRTSLDRWGLHGFKLQLLVNGLRADDERLFPIYEAVLERQKAVIIHATPFPMPQDNLKVKYVVRLLHRYPQLKLIIPHMGLYDTDIYADLLKEYPNLYLDTAFLFGNQKFPVPMDTVKEMLLRFQDRIIYGSDYPILENSPKESLQAFYSLNLSKEIERKILWENAHDFLDASPEPVDNLNSKRTL